MLSLNRYVRTLSAALFGAALAAAAMPAPLAAQASPRIVGPRPAAPQRADQTAAPCCR